LWANRRGDDEDGADQVDINGLEIFLELIYGFL
jgi:hypothetical protein